MKKGFTLIELMGVIALLALIALIVFPSILNQMKKIDYNISDANKKLIYSAVDDYIDDEDSAKLCLDAGGEFYVKISELKEKGFLSDNIELKTYETVFIYYENGKYEYKILNTKKINEPYTCEGVVKKYRVYKNGEAVYFNPNTGLNFGKCDDYAEANSCGLNRDGCLKWYAFNDDELSDKVSLVLDHFSQRSMPASAAGANSSDDSYLAGSKYGWGVNYRAIKANEVAELTGNDNFNVETTNYTEWFYLDSNNQEDTVDDLSSSAYSWLLEDCTNYSSSSGKKNTNYTSSFYTSSYVKNLSTNGTWMISGGALRYTVSDSLAIKPVIVVSKDLLE